MKDLNEEKTNERNTSSFQHRPTNGFFALANSELIAELPLAVQLFGRVKTIITQLEEAGISKTSSSTEGLGETRIKVGVFDELYEDLREIAGTASIIKKLSPDFNNKFILPRAKMNYQEAIERGKAFFADSEPSAVKKLFTDHGLDDSFREDLMNNINGLIESTQTQSDAKRVSVGHTAQITGDEKSFKR